MMQQSKIFQETAQKNRKCSFEGTFIQGLYGALVVEDPLNWTLQNFSFVMMTKDKEGQKQASVRAKGAGIQFRF